MTQKQIDERYHSVSGLKHDLMEIHKMLGTGDGEALKDFVIGTRDVSSFFKRVSDELECLDVYGKPRAR